MLRTALAAAVALALASPAWAQYEPPPPPAPGGAEVSVGGAQIAEAGGAAVFTVALSAAASSPVSVRYETWNGSAIAPGDFTNSPGTVVIPAGATSAPVQVPVVSDAIDEPDEVFFVHLAAVTSGSAFIGAGHHGTGTILDDDGAPSGVGADTRPPNTFIHGGPRSPTRSRRASFHLASTEPGSRFQCRIDRGRWRACGQRKTYRRLKPGWHTFRARAIDKAGNVDRTAAKKRWRIR